MFEATLRQVDPELQEEGITVIVRNFDAAVEVRGWSADAEHAIRLTTQLVDDPVAAIQEHANLADAARVFADHVDVLTPFQPVFWRGRKKLRRADDVFVRALRGAGLPTLHALEVAHDTEQLSGETQVFSPVLRAGRRLEGANLQARVVIHGRPTDVGVNGSLAEKVWDAAKSGKPFPIRLRGRWLRIGDGELVLDKPEIIAIDSDFSLATGHELLEDIRARAGVFASIDFEEALNGIRSGREE